MRVENFWIRVRGLHGPPRRWELQVEGLDHYTSAKASGRGVILWRMHFCDSPVVNAALHAHGITLIHLSREGHGSTSRLGLRFIAPLYTRTEMWYLSERVVIPKDDTLGYVRVLLARLGANATLSIFGVGRGRQKVATTMLGRTAKFPTGSPALAFQQGAALLSVYGVRLGPYQYRVVIEAPIAPPTDTSRASFVAEAVTEYARRLEAQILAHPADWLGWLPQYRP